MEWVFHFGVQHDYVFYPREANARAYVGVRDQASQLFTACLLIDLTFRPAS